MIVDAFNSTTYVENKMDVQHTPLYDTFTIAANNPLNNLTSALFTNVGAASGKTEAYLGLACCAMLYDRLRNKRFGMTDWLRFPLRMLSIQQLQRAMRVETYQRLLRTILFAVAALLIWQGGRYFIR